MEAGDLWQLSAVSQALLPPEAAMGAVMYQVFPDRFAISGSCDLTGKLQPYWVHENLDDTPVFRPDEKGEVLNNDFYVSVVFEVFCETVSSPTHASSDRPFAFSITRYHVSFSVKSST